MFSTFGSTILYPLTHVERCFRTFKTFHSLKKPTTEAKHPGCSPPHTDLPVCECWKEEVLGTSLNGLQQVGDGVGWADAWWRAEAALFLGSPAYPLLRTRLAWTRLMTTVNHLSKYVLNLRCVQETSVGVLVGDKEKHKIGRQKQQQGCQQNPKQK